MLATAPCVSDLDCSLNGVCGYITTGVCECDLPWTGDSCGVLRRLPANASRQASVYGYSPNVTSWGASILRGEEDPPMYHMFVAEIPGGLLNWGSKSQCVHAVSPREDGPFVRSDVVLAAECHGPVAIRDTSDGAWLLFHQGAGPASSNSSGFLRYAHSPNGPWTPIDATPAGRGDKLPCGMPTAAFHPNGTLFVVCGNGAELRSAPSRAGPWSPVRIPLPRGAGWEDPTLWFDRRGNFHVINHVYSLAPYSAGKFRVASGHMFSHDGIEWHRAVIAPFDGVVAMDDGSNITFATRERPQLLFADDDRTTPAALTSAVSSQPIGPMCDSCSQGACSQCKVTAGRDWTHTIYQRLDFTPPDTLDAASNLGALPPGPGPFGSVKLSQPVPGAARALSPDGWKRGKLCDVSVAPWSVKNGTNATAALQHAIDECGDLPGGGTVLIPAPLTLLSASLFLRSNLTFRVEEGAVLRSTATGSTKTPESTGDAPIVYARRNSLMTPAHAGLLNGGVCLKKKQPLVGWDDCALWSKLQNVVIEGGGLLDADGDDWYLTWGKQPHVDQNQRPMMLDLMWIDGLTIRDMKIRRPGYWTVHPTFSNNVRVTNNSIVTYGSNTDGVGDSAGI